MKLSRNVYNEILKSFDLKQEDGGILGMKDDTIVSFCFDKGDKESEYTINVSKFSNVMDEWDQKGISFAGFIHSHLHGFNPSFNDLIYLKRFLKANEDIQELYFPIVYKNEGKVDIRFYVFKNNGFEEISYILVS